MAEENNKTKDISEKEEKDFLARGEIKTMKKDIAGLRETQAKQERERIAKIKTVEETQKEKERQERAEKAAKERELAIKEAGRKEEDLKRMKETREKREKGLEKAEAQKEELRAEEFRGVLKETQTKEEEERKRFLERVEAKAEGKEEITPPLTRPTPPPIPQPTTPPIPSPKKPAKIPAFLKKPSLTQKLWIRIVLSLLVLAILAAIVTFWYWYLVIREKPKLTPPPTPPITEEELIIPSALISMDDVKTLKATNFVNLLSQTLEENLGEDKFTRILIKNIEENRIWGLKEFFEIFSIIPPEGFYSKINNGFTLFIYSFEGENRLGFIAEVRRADLSYLLESWEPTMEKDLENLFIFLDKTGPATSPSFKEATHENTVFRYLSFPTENFGICWALIDNYFIFTSSGTSIVKTIDKINE